MRSAVVILLCAAVTVGACNNSPDSGAKAKANPGGPVIHLMPEPERIVVEAESAKLQKPFDLADDGLASGGRCVVLAEQWETHKELHPAFVTKEGRKPVTKSGLDKNPLGSALVPNGTAEISFEVTKAAKYALWARAYFHCSCADSFYISVDTDPPVDTDGDGEYDENAPGTVAGSTRKRWKWFEYKGGRFELATGTHTLRIFPREDGIKIDQVLFAEIPAPPRDEWVPQGNVEASSPPPASGDSEKKK